MTEILVHIEAPQSIADDLLREGISNLQVISARELAWRDSPRFGLAEGILVIGAIKGLAELGKVIIEIVKLLKASEKSDATVRIALPDGTDATIRSDSDPKDIADKIGRASQE